MWRASWARPHAHPAPLPSTPRTPCLAPRPGRCPRQWRHDRLCWRTCAAHGLLPCTQAPAWHVTCRARPGAQPLHPAQRPSHCVRAPQYAARPRQSWAARARSAAPRSRSCAARAARSARRRPSARAPAAGPPQAMMRAALQQATRRRRLQHSKTGWWAPLLHRWQSGDV